MPLQDSDIFLVTKADGSESRHIRADKLFSGIADDWFVVIQDGTQSKRCLVSALPDKASDTRYMLVNQGATSYKVKSSVVVNNFNDDFPDPLNRIVCGANYTGWINAAGKGSTSQYAFKGLKDDIVATWGTRQTDYVYCITPSDVNGKCYSYFDGGNTASAKPETLISDTGGPTLGVKLYRNDVRIKSNLIRDDDTTVRCQTDFRGAYYPGTDVGGGVGWWNPGQHTTAGAGYASIGTNFNTKWVQGSDSSITVSINVSNTAKSSTCIAAACFFDGEVKTNPACEYGGSYNHFGNSGIGWLFETALGYTGTIEIKGTSNHPNGADLLFCWYTITYP